MSGNHDIAETLLNITINTNCRTYIGVNVTYTFIVIITKPVNNLFKKP